MVEKFLDKVVLCHNHGALVFAVAAPNMGKIMRSSSEAGIKKTVCGVIAVMLIAGCAAQSATYTVNSRFTFDEAKFINDDGPNTITGQAFMRTVGGEVRTCAGYPALLVPVTPYASERMRLIYGSTSSGYRDVSHPYEFTNDTPTYMAMMREEVCDAEGDFEFLNVPDGNYYLVAKVIWAIPGQYNQNYQGGGMMKRVSVNDGEHVKVLISP